MFSGIANDRGPGQFMPYDPIVVERQGLNMHAIEHATH